MDEEVELRFVEPLCRPESSRAKEVKDGVFELFLQVLRGLGQFCLYYI